MTTLVSLSRRRFLGCTGVASATLLTGCSTQGIGAFFEPVVNVIAPKTYDGEQPDPAVIYAARTDEGFSLPAIPYKNIPQRFYRQRVIDPTGEAPGTVVVDTKARYLYLVEKGGTAMRYGVSIGKEGFAWQGEGVIQWRKKWPRWTPPDEMVARQPKLARYSIANGGQEPGLRNPLGARALYIFQNGQDTLYRLHGNPDWRSIGKAQSSGCVRFINQDIIDLYDRVPEGARIVVRQ
ncbi:L,D-transpeptidase [Rhizobium sp. NFR03]|uniref:L,D-transpeptidase n=1 Tax=Rhizobium sp. NFR03 TaxID=1566263 RepID=UPI0008AD7B64|nr:L,D-transpeptidase [Rhizobium sp. NFR03]SES23621.1 Lipoprotein-anchoring transpeptidase ErfK/SrfK [Rhizobium sp. NFR03]